MAVVLEVDLPGVGVGILVLHLQLLISFHDLRVDVVHQQEASSQTISVGCHPPDSYRSLSPRTQTHEF